MHCNWLDLQHPPSSVYIQAGNKSNFIGAKPIVSSRRMQWTATGVLVDLIACPNETLSVNLHADETSLRRIILHWQHVFPSDVRFLGDAWERSYGELEWRGSSPHRFMPWYFLATNGSKTFGYGVETGCASIACWTADAEGVTLELDVRAGGQGVNLGPRVLKAATLVQRPPHDGETPFAATKKLCQTLCPHSICPSEPIVGHNDWYWLYGKNSASVILEATERLVDLCPQGTTVRPWSVIDDGWQRRPASDGEDECNGGPWDRSNKKFPDMPGLAAQIRARGARPGIWMRPLLTKARVPSSWKINRPASPPNGGLGATLDPTIPEVIDLIRTDIARLRDWGFELVKHDFSTFDITGRWGFEMNALPDRFAPEGWSFSDSSRTTAEVISDLYKAIHEAAGSGVTLVGCNTVGHLAAGLVEIQRIGDDVSASDWDRTRRMGINALAFRTAQNKAFFAADADCVPISPSIPWHLTKSWLDLVSRSGTPLFLSINPNACNRFERATIKEALAMAMQPAETAEPLDWLAASVPIKWHFLQNKQSRKVCYQWNDYETHE